MKDLGFVIWICTFITTLVVLFHISFIKDPIPLSDCHSAEIRIYNNKPMCTECKLFCEVKK
jgi:hypothetical protein